MDKPKLPKKALQMFREWGAAGGRKSQETLGEKERSKLARKAGLASAEARAAKKKASPEIDISERIMPEDPRKRST